MEQLRNRVAVITGGASGIGFATAEALAREGVRIVLADIERGALDAAVARIRALGVQGRGRGVRRAARARPSRRSPTPPSRRWARCTSCS